MLAAVPWNQIESAVVVVGNKNVTPLPSPASTTFEEVMLRPAYLYCGDAASDHRAVHLPADFGVGTELELVAFGTTNRDTVPINQIVVHFTAFKLN